MKEITFWISISWYFRIYIYFTNSVVPTKQKLACHSVVCLTVDQITHLKGHLSYSLKIDIENAAEENACYLRKALRQRTINQQKP